MHGADGRQQLPAQHALEQIAGGAGGDRALRQHVALVRGEHHDAGVGEFLADGDGGVDAVHVRHLDVHQRDVRLQAAIRLHGLHAVRGLLQQLHVVFIGDHAGDAFAEHRVVVHAQDFDRRSGHRRLVHRARRE
ncbi:conserved hypothetical protein [Ricinus communis]|uniref:Uncharacterized protein n=1 Tax=Ricinus communis TaxID=3988 RepID=B9THN1_RICCO|nr:conserved hypothetical protein [Ricinus communis]